MRRHDGQLGGGTGRGPRGPGAFTLTEMMVVLFILGVILALVVGVSRYVTEEAGRKQTHSTQDVVMSAIRKYKELHDDYPPDSDDGKSLMNTLYDDPIAKPMLANVQREAWAGYDKALKDGFEYSMRYRKTGARGGGPLLESPGPDGDFGDTEPDKKEDNIRSDE